MSTVDGSESTMIAAASSNSASTSTAASSVTTTTTTTTTLPCSRLEPSIETFVYSSIEGVSDRFTSIDVHHPAGCAIRPVVLWVHGGGWSGGDKGNPDTARKASWLEGLGWTLVAVNYRLSNRYGLAEWPDHGNDVSDAIAFVVANSRELSIDASRLVLLGHSAGGHLVSIVASDPRFMDQRAMPSETIDCVVALDTEGYRLSDKVTAAPEMVINAFGVDPTVLDDASPSVQVERVGAPKARVLVVTRGSLARREMASEYVDLILTAGGTATLYDAGDYSHTDVNALLGTDRDDRVTPVVEDFLRTCLGT